MQLTVINSSNNITVQKKTYLWELAEKLKRLSSLSLTFKVEPKICIKQNPLKFKKPKIWNVTKISKGRKFTVDLLAKWRGEEREAIKEEKSKERQESLGEKMW